MTTYPTATVLAGYDDLGEALQAADVARAMYPTRQVDVRVSTTGIFAYEVTAR